MKKVWMMILALVLATVLCTAAAETPKTEVVVFAAASMTETLTEIEALYEKANPEIDLIFNFDSSGTLKTQIQEGAVCDLFISAGQKQMNQLDITRDEEKNPERLDFVLEESPGCTGPLMRFNPPENVFQSSAAEEKPRFCVISQSVFPEL